MWECACVYVGGVCACGRVVYVQVCVFDWDMVAENKCYAEVRTGHRLKFNSFVKWLILTEQGNVFW